MGKGAGGATGAVGVAPAGRSYSCTPTGAAVENAWGCISQLSEAYERAQRADDSLQGSPRAMEVHPHNPPYGRYPHSCPAPQACQSAQVSTPASSAADHAHTANWLHRATASTRAETAFHPGIHIAGAPVLVRGKANKQADCHKGCFAGDTHRALPYPIRRRRGSADTCRTRSWDDYDLSHTCRVALNWQGRGWNR